MAARRRVRGGRRRRGLVEAAREAGVGRLVYLSHLGMDRASAYPVLKRRASPESSSARAA
jgi:hypothetical protein